MAGRKITQLDEDTNPSSDDFIITVNNPDSDPINAKVRLSNLFKVFRSANRPSDVVISSSGDIEDYVSRSEGVRVNTLNSAVTLSVGNYVAEVGDCFSVVDVAGNASENNITIDFTNFFFSREGSVMGEPSNEIVIASDYSYVTFLLMKDHEDKWLWTIAESTTTVN